MNTPWSTIAANPSLPFSDYIQHWRHYIMDNGYTHQLPALQREDNLPFEWQPAHNKTNGRYQNGVLLVHGYNETAYALRNVGEIFANQGYLVRSLMLPGHGTSPIELTTIPRKTWKETVEYGIRSLRPDCESLTVVGNSLGCALGLIYAYRYPELIDRLLLLAPALGVRTPMDYFARWQKTLRTPWHAQKWHARELAVDYAKYTRSHIKSMLQSMLIMREAYHLSKVHTLTPPVTALFSVDDETINVKKIEQWYGTLKHEKNHCVIYSKNPPDSTKNITQRSSVFEEQKILDFSHTCLHHRPDNPHYGQSGDYIDYQHYPQAPDCVPNCWGAITRDNLKYKNLARLHYNPDFEYLAEIIQSF